MKLRTWLVILGLLGTVTPAWADLCDLIVTSNPLTRFVIKAYQDGQLSIADLHKAAVSPRPYHLLDEQTEDYENIYVRQAFGKELAKPEAQSEWDKMTAILREQLIPTLLREQEQKDVAHKRSAPVIAPRPLREYDVSYKNLYVTLSRRNGQALLAFVNRQCEPEIYDLATANLVTRLAAIPDCAAIHEEEFALALSEAANGDLIFDWVGGRAIPGGVMGTTVGTLNLSAGETSYRTESLKTHQSLQLLVVGSQRFLVIGAKKPAATKWVRPLGNLGAGEPISWPDGPKRSAAMNDGSTLFLTSNAGNVEVRRYDGQKWSRLPKDLPGLAINEQKASIYRSRAGRIYIAYHPDDSFKYRVIALNRDVEPFEVEFPFGFRATFSENADGRVFLYAEVKTSGRDVYWVEGVYLNDPNRKIRTPVDGDLRDPFEPVLFNDQRFSQDPIMVLVDGNSLRLFLREQGQVLQLNGNYRGYAREILTTPENAILVVWRTLGTVATYDLLSPAH